jgi:hypothetical protein
MNEKLNEKMNEKDETDVIESEEALRFIGKKYIYVYEHETIQIFDSYLKLKRFVLNINYKNKMTVSEMHDFIIYLKKCRLVVENMFEYEPALFNLNTMQASFCKIVNKDCRGADYVYIPNTKKHSSIDSNVCTMFENVKL